MELLRRGNALAFLCMFTCGVIPLRADTNMSSKGFSLPSSIQKSINQFYPGTRLLEMKDMDLTSCGMLTEQPGIVQADFDGNGILDYALLLISTKVKREYAHPNGRILYLVGTFFVVFQGQREGKYQPILIETRETWLPSSLGLAMARPGRFKTWDSSKTLELKNPAIERYICEQQAAVFYWDTDRYSPLLISN